MPLTLKFKKLKESVEEFYLGRPVPTRFKKEFGKIYNKNEILPLAIKISKSRGIQIEQWNFLSELGGGKTMNKKGEIGIGGIVILFVGIIFALALLSPIADTIGLMQNKQVVSNQTVSTVTGYVDDNNVNESINYSVRTQSAWKVIDCPLGSVVVRNAPGTTLVLNADYTLDANNGRYSLLNTSDTVPATALNLTYADYDYCADGYNKDTGSRSMLGLILLFSSLIILGFVLEKSGVTNMKDAFG